MNVHAPFRDDYARRDVEDLYSDYRRMVAFYIDRMSALKAAGLPMDEHNREHLEHERDRITALLGEGK
jgi:hypothetical protein